MTARTYLIHGLVAGLVAGLLAFAVASWVGEPAIDDAIALEESAAAPADDHGEGEAHSHGDEGHSHGEEAGGHSHGEDEGGVSRGQQAGAGLATALLLFGAVLGGVVGIGAAFVAGRLGGVRPAAAVALVAVVGFVSYALVPWLKYPPNPPAVGDGETIGERTALYFGFVGVSVLAAVAAVVLAAQLLPRIGGWAAATAATLGYVAVVLVAGLVLAPIDEAPDTFPATVLFDFRVGSLLTQLALWATLAVVLSGLVDRAYRRVVADERRRALAASL